ASVGLRRFRGPRHLRRRANRSHKTWLIRDDLHLRRCLVVAAQAHDLIDQIAADDTRASAGGARFSIGSACARRAPGRTHAAPPAVHLEDAEELLVGRVLRENLVDAAHGPPGLKSGLRTSAKKSSASRYSNPNRRAKPGSCGPLPT